MPETQAYATPAIHTTLRSSISEQTEDDRYETRASFHENIVRDVQSPSISRPPTQFTPINPPKLAISQQESNPTNPQQEKPSPLPTIPCDNQRSTNPLPIPLVVFTTPPSKPGRPLPPHPQLEPTISRKVAGVKPLIEDKDQPLDIGAQVPPAFQPTISDSSMPSFHVWNVRNGQRFVPQHNRRLDNRVRIGPYITPEGLDSHICRYLVRRWVQCETSHAMWKGTAAEINQYQKALSNGSERLVDPLSPGSPHDQDHVYETPTTDPAFRLQVDISRDSPENPFKKIKTANFIHNPQSAKGTGPPLGSNGDPADEKGRSGFQTVSKTSTTMPKLFTFSTSLTSTLTSKKKLVDEPISLISSSPEKIISCPSLNNGTNTIDHSQVHGARPASLNSFHAPHRSVEDEKSNDNCAGSLYQSVGQERDNKRMRLLHGNVSKNREETIEVGISPQNHEAVFDDTSNSNTSATYKFEQTISHEDGNEIIECSDANIEIEDDSEAETVIDQSLTDGKRLKEFTTADGKNFYVERTTQWVLSGVE